MYFTQDYHSHTDISASVSAVNEDEVQSIQEQNPLLYLDIARGESEYRVQVMKRKSKGKPYTIKVWNVDQPDTVVKTSVHTLSRTSSGIRQHIWDNLQVELSPDGNHLIGVYFTCEHHSVSEASLVTTKIEAKEQHADPSPMLFLDITRGEQQYRVQVYKRLGPDDPYQIKVWNINDAENSVKTQVQSLSRTSSGIR